MIFPRVAVESGRLPANNEQRMDVTTEQSRTTPTNSAVSDKSPSCRDSSVHKTLLSPRTAERRRSNPPHLTREARFYALKELARRAGVTRPFFDSWTVEFRTDRMVVTLDSVSQAQLHFVLPKESWVSGPGSIPVAHASWMRETSDEPAPRNFVLPFCSSDQDHPGPLFSPGPEGLVCQFDVLASLAYTLSRTEEAQTDQRDPHGRFPAAESVSTRHGFLERPVVDELGCALQQAISALLPSWKPEPRRLRLKLTHEVDSAGIPFNLRSTMAHAVKRKRPRASVRDFVSVFSDREPAELAAVRDLADLSEQRGWRSSFYWKASPAGPYDSGYNPTHPKVRRVISELRERGHELGVHPGYNTFCNRDALAVEVDSLRHALCVRRPGGRQHYLRWSPQTWRDWEACGLWYDSSVGFAERFGFRAGTAFPYCPWSFRENRELDLIELPLILMDCTPVKYMALSRDVGLHRIKALIERVAKVGGVFTLLWHNSPLLDPEYAGWYEAILDMLSGAENFELPGDVSRLW